MTEQDKRTVKKLIKILDMYEGKTSLISNQGQALDGYSALAEFISIAEEARAQHDKSNRP